MKMKLLNLRIFLLVIITGLMLTTCKKDSDPEDDLVGTWTTESATFDVMIGTQTLQQYLVSELGLTEPEAQQMINLFNSQMQQSFTGTITMKSDNTYTATLGGESDSGTWSLSSDNKKLTIDSDTEDPVIFDIIELTSSLCHLQGTETTNEDLNGDDVPETMTIAIDMVLTK